jgi:hypothetical protein
MIVFLITKETPIEQDPTGKGKATRILAKLDVESTKYPFFKRICHLRHVLNHNSPWLRQEANQLVRLNGGYWPMELQPRGSSCEFSLSSDRGDLERHFK